jgi:hypothetical protein
MAMKPEELFNLAVTDKFPDYFHPGQGDLVPDDLLSAMIVRCGAPDLGGKTNSALEGGGLVIDYIPKGMLGVKRLVLSLNDLGINVVMCDHLPEDNETIVDSVPLNTAEQHS